MRRTKSPRRQTKSQKKTVKVGLGSVVTAWETGASWTYRTHRAMAAGSPSVAAGHQAEAPGKARMIRSQAGTFPVTPAFIHAHVIHLMHMHTHTHTNALT